MGDEPAPYEIRVDCHLGPALRAAFPALTATHAGGETVLTGLLDTAGLFGVLAEVEALGLELLEVRKIRSPPPE